jgi:hypothetical protein
MSQGSAQAGMRIALLLWAATAALLPAQGVRAQAQTPPAEQPLETIEVRGRQEEPPSVLPTRQPIASVFGDSRSILATPRSVSVLSETQLRDAAVTRILDLPRLASSTQAPNTFGYASLPTIRGQEGELFVNGIRRGGGNNGYGFPVSFNAFEAIHVVKGPASAVYGPTQRVGGYLDLVTKRPALERWTGSLGASYGSWAQRKWTLDLGGPLDAQERLGVRFSYEGQDSDSFYDFVEEKSDALYGALTWQATRALTLDWSIDYYEVEFDDNAGWNRPTQDLIDHGLYLTGTAQRFAPTSLRQVITPTGRVKLSRDEVLSDPDDRSTAQTLSGQFSATYQLGDRASFVNRSFLQSLEKETINQNSFREILKENYIAENRSELHWSFPLQLGAATWENRSVAGFDVRWNHAVGYSQFSTEADNPIDITAPLETRRRSASEVATLGDFVSVDGLLMSPGGSYTVQTPFENLAFAGNGDSNGSDAYQYGLFYQHDVNFTPELGLLLGTRGDLVHVKSKDPIPPPGERAARDRLSLLQGAASASLHYRPLPESLYYASYGFSQSSPTAIGGGFPLDGGNRLRRENFRTESQLFEAGAKWSLLENSLFLGVSAFRQSRVVRNRDGSNSGLIVNGAELELAWAPRSSRARGASRTPSTLRAPTSSRAAAGCPAPTVPTIRVKAGVRTSPASVPATSATRACRATWPACSRATSSSRASAQAWAWWA